MPIQGTANPDVAIMTMGDDVSAEYKADYEQFRRFIGKPEFMSVSMEAGQKAWEILQELDPEAIAGEQLSELNSKQASMTMHLSALSYTAALVMYRAVVEDGLSIEKVALFLDSMRMNAGTNLAMLFDATDPASRQ